MKCPRCEAEIKELYVTIINKVRATYDGKIFKDEADMEGEEEFECPECAEILAENEADAQALLEG